MRLKQYSRKLKDLVVMLGSDTDVIAASLAAKGIRGHRGSDESCPLARYLSIQFPAEHVSVNSAGIFVGHLSLFRVRRNKNTPTAPPVLFKFIRDFDTGLYPELDANH